MDFDTAKENIQPLKGGRRADRLETVLGGEKELLDQERKEHEEAINTYNGPDPLEAWYSYICWIEQSYPKSGNESGLHETVSKCLLKFENDMRYRQDRRLIKLFIKYIDTQDNPHELYEQLFNSGIGTMVSDLYIAWSYYYDATNDFKKAESIFQRGFSAGAQPYDELAQAHQAFSISVTQRMFYDDDLSKKKFQASMDEKRNALTTLRTYNKKYVGSIRVGQAIRSNNPGIIPVNENVEENRQQLKINIHTDDNAHPSDQFPSSSSSGVKSIFDMTKKVENLHEAGPWNKASKSSKNKLFDSKSIVGSQPGFAIMEDESLPPIPCNNKLYEKGCILPPNWVSKNKPQNPWNIPTVIEEPAVANSIPMYDKFLLYPSPDIEISSEELKGYRWFKSRGDTSAKIILQLASVFENKYEYGARIMPGFQSKNIKQDNVKFPLDYETNNPSFQFPIDKMISNDGSTEYSNDELLAEKFKRGEIKLVANEDFEETLIDDNMDMTVIGERRESVYCISRKSSFVPRKSILRKSVMQPLHEEDNITAKSTENRVRFEEPIVEQEEKSEERRSLPKRKLEIEEEERENNVKDRSASPESKRLSSDEDHFKTPAAPKSISKPLFEVLEDENNETFSTQKFNFFIKSQSVSTPISKKTAPRLVPLSTIESQQEELQKPDTHEVGSPVENSMLPNNLQKQLSTIAEVTESSNSTKSSVSQMSGENEADSHAKTHSKISPCKVGKKWEDCSQNPLNMFRIPEERTETTPFIKSFMLPKLKDLQQPSFRIFQDSPSSAEISCKIPLLEDSIDVPHSNESLHIVNEDHTKKETSQNSITETPKMTEAVQDEDKSIMFIPSDPQDIENPQTQNISGTQHVEIPATQDLSNADDSLEIPALSDLTLKQNVAEILEKSNEQKLQLSGKKSACLDIPQIKEDSIKNGDDLEVPGIENLSLKDSSDHLEIPETQELSLEHEEIPATQEISIQQGPNLLLEISTQPALVENNKIPFSVYEDSVCEVAPKIVVNPPPILNSQSQSSNMSRKENLILSELKRTTSDEFLELCTKSPHIPRKMQTNTTETKNEVSDLLKFSDVKSKLSLEASFNDMQLNNKPLKSPSPTMNILDADLNTMNFNLPLKFGKNSTIIGEVVKISPIAKLPEMDDSLNLSIEMDEEESQRLGQKKLPIDSNRKSGDVFKVPLMPASVPKYHVEPAQTSNKKDEFEIFQDEEDDGDLSKSIYYNNKKDFKAIEIEELESWEDEKMCSFIAEGQNRYEYTIIQQPDDSISFKLRDAIIKSNGNPFRKEIRNMILEQCNFEQYLEDHVDSCTLIKNVPQLKPGGSLQCGNEMYKVQKILGKGGFGSVFEVRNLKNNESYAAKQEKPANMWEYYILIELASRLCSKKITHMIPAYMHVNRAIIANNASVFISEYSPFGSIIDICNKFKASTGRNVDEYVGMIFASQLLSIMDYLHSCHIIHADIKPDNFLLMSKIEIGMKVPALQLIDFGSAIDMESFDKDDEFTYVIKTDNFTCCEMLEKKPWTYQTDLFGLCGTVHVILFGKYMEVEKKLNNWQIKTRFPRYFQKYLWDIFFNTLLNVPDCKSMPNLQNIKQQLDEEIAFRQKYIFDKVKEFNNALLS